MPHVAVKTPSGTLPLPFGGRSPRARRSSLSGAQVAVSRAFSQAARMLREYLQAGMLTDLEMAGRIGIPESRVSARRNGLIAQRKVEYAHQDKWGPSGAISCCWRLTNYGREVAQELERAAVK